MRTASKRLGTAPATVLILTIPFAAVVVDLLALGDSLGDYDKPFILTAVINERRFSCVSTSPGRDV